MPLWNGSILQLSGQYNYCTRYSAITNFTVLPSFLITLSYKAGKSRRLVIPLMICWDINPRLVSTFLCSLRHHSHFRTRVLFEITRSNKISVYKNNWELPDIISSLYSFTFRLKTTLQHWPDLRLVRYLLQEIELLNDWSMLIISDFLFYPCSGFSY